MPIDHHEFMLTLVRSGLVLPDLMSNLIEAEPIDGASPLRGEDVFEMFCGSAAPALRRVGVEQVREATALVQAVMEQILADLRLASELATRRAAADPA